MTDQMPFAVTVVSQWKQSEINYCEWLLGCVSAHVVCHSFRCNSNLKKNSNSSTGWLLGTQDWGYACCDASANRLGGKHTCLIKAYWPKCHDKHNTNPVCLITHLYLNFEFEFFSGLNSALKKTDTSHGRIRGLIATCDTLRTMPE